MFDFQQFTHTAAHGEAERHKYHLHIANHTLHTVIAKRNEQAVQRAARHQVPPSLNLSNISACKPIQGTKSVWRSSMVTSSICSKTASSCTTDRTKCRCGNAYLPTIQHYRTLPPKQKAT
ncbi:Uncharacterised protein [Helicobacter pametensis]|nr:Uncharacterised protein [Helicobacter pametensis]